MKLDTAFEAESQALLVAALDRLKQRLMGAPLNTQSETLATPTLERLATTFGLSAFERDILLLCAGPELSSAFAEACAAARGSKGRGCATFGLALAALDRPHWSALRPDGPLRAFDLVRLNSAEGRVVDEPLTLDEPLLHFIAGGDWFDERVERVVVRAHASDLVPSQARARHQIENEIAKSKGRLVIGIRGPRNDVRAVAAAATAHEGPLLVLHAGDVPVEGRERRALATRLRREQLLGRGTLLIDANDCREEALRSATTLAASVHGVVFVHSEANFGGAGVPSMRVEVRAPLAAEQRMLWSIALGDTAAGRHETIIGALVEQFSLDAERIGEVVRETSGASADVAASLWDGARARTRGGLEDIAERIDAHAAWDEIVLPEPQLETLRSIASHVRQRSRVHRAWGVREGERGFGTTALFAGPSGTGKTMAAEILAHDLRLDLYRIDLSRVVSKYIGETEKNLRRAFDAAEEGGAILLFDEADALFGKRTEVSDSHDRHANIEVDYLLQRMDMYRGLAILTTNLKNALDSAFLRRLRFVIDFPFPERSQRAEMWRRAFPRGVASLGLAPERLGNLRVAGGSIRNIALHATFLAVGDDSPVTMAHVERAAKLEYAKLERTLSTSELGGFLE